MKDNDGDPRCPICGVIPNLEELTSEIWFGKSELPACCRHLVPTVEFGCVAEELAGICGGQLVWKQIRDSLSFALTEEWRKAGEEGQSHDLEGEYFIERFVEPCPAVAQVDLHCRDVGGVGCASVACTPFVWVTDRKAFAYQLLQQLTRVAAAPAKKSPRQRAVKRRLGLPQSGEPNNKGEGIWQITTSVVFGMGEGMPLGGNPGSGGSIDTTGHVTLNRLIKEAAAWLEGDLEKAKRQHEKLEGIAHVVSEQMKIPIPVLSPAPDQDDDLDRRLLRAYLNDLKRQSGKEGKSSRSVAEWIFVGYQAGEQLAVSGLETVNALLAKPAFVRANAGFYIRCSGGRMHAHHVRQEGPGAELYAAIIWFGRLLGRPQPNRDPRTVVGAAVDLFARKFHESIPLPAKPAQVALGAAQAALWLGFLNRALQSPQGPLADFLSKNVELLNWGGPPYVVAGKSAGTSA
jgi:hypothetical protein